MKGKLKVGIAQVLLASYSTWTKTGFKRKKLERRTSNLRTGQYKHYFFRHPICLTKNLKLVWKLEVHTLDYLKQSFLCEDEAQELFWKELKKIRYEESQTTPKFTAILNIYL